MPVNSYSFDENFQLSDDQEEIRDASPEHCSSTRLFMTDAELVKQKKSPTGKNVGGQAPQAASLLGGIFPISHAGEGDVTPGKQGEQRTISITLRIQYMQNAQNYLLEYKNKLLQT